MLEIARSLCSDLTGSRCRIPSMSDWALVAPSQSSIGVDVADVATGGAGAVVPINVKVYGSSFLSGLERHATYGGMSSQMTGHGVGAGLGAGWGLPFVGAKGAGKMPGGLKRKIVEAAGKATQGKVEELLRNSVFSGVSGGTKLVTGPDTEGDLTTDDFHGSWVTVAGLGLNFVVNGVSYGVVIVSKKKPVVETSDLIYARAIGLMGGIGLATSLDIEASGMVYRVGFA